MYPWQTWERQPPGTVRMMTKWRDTYLPIYLLYPPGREGGEGAKGTMQARFVSKIETTARIHRAGTLNMQPCKTLYIPYMAMMCMTTPRTAAGQHWLDSNLA